MAIEIPTGFVAVIVFVSKDEAESQVKLVGLTEDVSEHGCIAEAICALAGTACDISDELIEDREGDEEPDEEVEEPEEPAS